MGRRCVSFELTPTAEAGGGWPRRDNITVGPKRPGAACLRGSGIERGLRPHLAQGVGQANVYLNCPGS
jgi:hypothetical protein